MSCASSPRALNYALQHHYYVEICFARSLLCFLNYALQHHYYVEICFARSLLCFLNYALQHVSPDHCCASSIMLSNTTTMLRFVSPYHCCASPPCVRSQASHGAIQHWQKATHAARGDWWGPICAGAGAGAGAGARTDSNRRARARDEARGPYGSSTHCPRRSARVLQGGDAHQQRSCARAARLWAPEFGGRNDFRPQKRMRSFFLLIKYISNWTIKPCSHFLYALWI